MCTEHTRWKKGLRIFILRFVKKMTGDGDDHDDGDLDDF